MKNIVENHPIYVSENLIYTSKKLTKLIAIDPVSGIVVRTYGEESGEVFSSAFMFDELTSHSVIFIGRTQYIVKIQDKNGKYRWNITYSEFSSTNPMSMLTKEQLYSALKDSQDGQISTSVDGKFMFKDNQGIYESEMLFNKL
jgi:hypothetical protein